MIFFLSNPNVTYAGLPVDPNLIPKNHRGHPLKSFSIPAPPSCGTPIGHNKQSNYPIDCLLYDFTN